MSDSFNTEAVKALSELGEVLGFSDLEFDDEDDTCLLQLDGKLEIGITLNEASNEVVVHHCIGRLPEENRYEVIEQLLEANLFWAGTRGATLSIERERGDVFLARALNANGLDGARLGAVIADLADIAEYWGVFLEKGTIPQVKGVVPDAPSQTSFSDHSQTISEASSGNMYA